MTLELEVADADWMLGFLGIQEMDSQWCTKMGFENALRWAYKNAGGGAQFSHNSSERDESGLAIVEAIRPMLATRKEKWKRREEE